MVSEIFFILNMELCLYPTSSTSYPYKFRMSLFDNGKPEGFLLFVRNFNITILAKGTLEMGSKIQYFRTLVRDEALR